MFLRALPAALAVPLLLGGVPVGPLSPATARVVTQAGSARAHEAEASTLKTGRATQTNSPPQANQQTKPRMMAFPPETAQNL